METLNRKIEPFSTALRALVEANVLGKCSWNEFKMILSVSIAVGQISISSD